MLWKIIITDRFSREFKKFKRNHEFVNALDKKIERLKTDPENVGGYLSGDLHGHKSTRILRKYRLIFRIDLQSKSVYLEAIDHRKFDYNNF